jgi:hypothetical protein
MFISSSFGHWARCDRWYVPKQIKQNIWPSNMVTGTKPGHQIWLPQQKMAFKYGYRNKFIFGKLTPCNCTWRLPWRWWTSWTFVTHVLHVLLPIIVMVVPTSTPPSQSCEFDNCPNLPHPDVVHLFIVPWQCVFQLFFVSY